MPPATSVGRAVALQKINMEAFKMDDSQLDLANYIVICIAQ